MTTTDAAGPDFAHSLPLARGARVAAWSEGGVLALDKPAGVMTHPNDSSDRSAALLQADYDHEEECYHWPPTGPDDPGKLYLLNRLDSPTSGLVVAALNAEAAEAGRRAFAQGRAHKLYFALVHGRPHPPHGAWVDRLARTNPGGPAAGRGARVKVASGRDPGQMAETRYSCVETGSKSGSQLTLLRLEPVTGRTHQLRVQCAAHHHPILGDGTYGDFAFNRQFARLSGHKRLFLHAAAIRLPGLRFAAESPLPEEFKGALRAK